MAAKKVLFVLTNTEKIPNTDKVIGWWVSEVAHPFHVLAPKAEIVFASPKGGLAPVDPASVEFHKDDEVSQSFVRDHHAKYENTEKLETFLGRSDEFDAIFYPGGFGPMFDIATDPTSIQVIKEFAAKDKVLSAVCHGPAAFVNVTLDNGKHILDGKVVTAISNEEEEAFKMEGLMPFALETKLHEVTGGKYTAHDKDAATATVVVQDGGKLITGQNPKSGFALAGEILKSIGA